MNNKKHLIVIQGLLLIMILFLVSFSMEIPFALGPKWEGQLLNDRENIQLPAYHYKKNSPTSVGEITSSDNSYFRLKLKFRADDTEGYPNLFQTGPVNSGIRMEISGSTAAVIFPDKKTDNGLQVMILSTTLDKSRWYILEVESLNGAFVRVSLDGAAVANFAGKGVSFDTSQIIVGQGFDKTRPFKGSIENITVVKGNLALPHRVLRWIYKLVAFLFLLLIFVLYISTKKENEGAQKLLFRLALLLLPFILYCTFVEYRMSFLNTNYFTKRVAFEHQIDETEVLVLGSSNTFYGVSPEEFNEKGFNLSFPGSGMYYDDQLGKKFIKRMPKLKTVVLTANYFTMGLDYSTFSQSWRKYALSQNFGVPIRTFPWISFDLMYWEDPRNFSRVALHGSFMSGNEYYEPVDITASSLGWFNGGDVSVDVTKSLGVDAAHAHNSTNDITNYSKNLDYWNNLMVEIRKQNRKAVVVVLPTDTSYYLNLDKSKFLKMHNAIADFASQNNIKFKDYTGDPRFGHEDFTWEMPDHMSAVGAAKFSKILDKELIAGS